MRASVILFLQSIYPTPVGTVFAEILVVGQSQTGVLSKPTTPSSPYPPSPCRATRTEG